MEFNPWLSMVKKAVPNGLGLIDQGEMGQIDELQSILGSPQGTLTPGGFAPNPTPKGNQPQVVPPPTPKKPPFDPFSGMPAPEPRGSQEYIDEVPAVMDELNAMPELDIQVPDDLTDEAYYYTPPQDEVPNDYVPQPPQPPVTAQPTTSPLGTLPQEIAPQQPPLMGGQKTSRQQLADALETAMSNYSDLQGITQEEIDEMRMNLADYKNMDQGVDFTPLAALSDAWFGGNLTAAAKQIAPQSPAERAQTISALQEKIVNAQRDIPKAELDAMKLRLEQLSYMDQRDNALEIAKLQAQARQNAMGQGYGLRQKGFEEKVDARLDQDVQKLEKRIGDVAPGILSKLNNLNSLIPGGLDAEGEVDIPGVGPGQFLIPDFLMGPEASNIQSIARGLAADLIKLQSGTAASEKEVDRKMKELGMSAGSKSSTFLAGLRRLREQLTMELRNKEAGFRPDAVDAYRSRNGITYRDVISIGSKAPAQAPGGAMTFEQWKASGGQ